MVAGSPGELRGMPCRIFSLTMGELSWNGAELGCRQGLRKKKNRTGAGLAESWELVQGWQGPEVPWEGLLSKEDRCST